MISYDDVINLFSGNLEGKRCIEIEFCVRKHPRYRSCWMGKTPDRENKDKEVYWFGLMPDGSEAYDYESFRDFCSAPVFDGKSLEEIFEKIEIFSIDGCDPVK